MAHERASRDRGTITRKRNDDQLVPAVQQHARTIHRVELTMEPVRAMPEPERKCSSKATRACILFLAAHPVR